MEEKRAIKRIVRGDNGQVRVILIDAKTLQEVTNPAGYRVINANSNFVEPVGSVENPETPSVIQGQLPLEMMRPDGQTEPTTAQSVKSGVSKPSAPQQASKPATVAPVTTTPAPVSPAISAPPSAPTSPAPTTTTPTTGLANPVDPLGTFSKGVATPETATPGTGGLAALAESSKEGMGKTTVDESGLAGKGRGYAADAEIMAAIQETVDEMFGPGHTVNVTSGTYSPEQQQQFAAGNTKGQIGSSRHNFGKAVDFGVIGPSGKALSPTQMADLGQSLAAKGFTGIGVGKGYMDADGQSKVHADKSGKGLATWGAGNTKATMDPQQRSNIETGLGIGKGDVGKVPAMPYYDPPTPTPNPGPPTTGNPLTEEPSTQDQGIGKGMVDAARDPATMTPAEIARTEFGPKRTAEEIAAMGRTIAGELSPGALKGLSEGSLSAMQEMANMIATMENRAQSKNNKTGSMLGILGGNSYNSNLSSNSGVTNDNFSKFGEAVMKGLEDYYGGGKNMTPTNPSATHYYNPDISNPDWGPQMQGSGRVGSHVFGSLPGEFSPGEGFKGDLAQAAGPSRNTPSENGGRFGGAGLGYTGFGIDSPAENGPGPGMGTGQSGGYNSPSESIGGPGYGAGYGGYSGLGGYDSPSESGGGPGSGAGQSYGGPGEGVGGGPGMGGGQNYGGPGEGHAGGPGMGAGQNYGGPGEGVGGGPGMGAGIGGGSSYGGWSGPDEGSHSGPGGPNGTGGPGHGIGWV